MTHKNILSSVALISLMTLVPSSFAAESVGVNSAVRGDVTITDAEAREREALVKDKVMLGEEVTSAKQSTLQVLLNDQTVFTVGPDCVLTINKFVYDPTKTSSSMSANVKKGMFRFMSGNIAKFSSEAVTIDSPVASMGIRGTIVEGLVGQDAVDLGRRLGVLEPGQAVDRDGATLFILRGPGQNSRSNNRSGEIDVTSGGKTVTIKESGMATFVQATGVQPTDPFMLPDDIYELFSRNLRTSPTQNSFTAPDPIEIEYFDPVQDMDWPEDHGQIGIPTTPGGGGTQACTPQNPIWPNC